MSEESSTYALGWDDGYSEGYACKLTDATEKFNPVSLDAPDMVERIADHVARRYSTLFNRGEAMGLARAVLRIAKEPRP